MQRLNRIPETGDTVDLDGVQMEVKSVERNAVQSIRLRLPANGTPVADTPAGGSE